MFPPLVPLLLVLLCALCPTSDASSCRLSEFSCRNGRCVASGRYCDGTDDCGDQSDEPQHCNNCNRTFYAEANVKHSVRMSTPYRRPLPFVCRMTFVGGQHGDQVQLTFLSFQIGALEMDNASNPACSRGYLQISEAPSVPGAALLSQQTRGFTQLLSALKQPPTRQLSSLFSSSGGGNPEFGRLCGEMVGKSATYYAGGNNVTIVAVVPDAPPHHPSTSFSVHLTYKYLTTSNNQQHHPHSSEQRMHPTGEQQQPQHYYYGSRLPHTFCDRVLVDCDRKRCALRSPHFPGFYPRNLTCEWRVRQEWVPRGAHPHIVLAQSNEYKISLYTGRSSPIAHPRASLTGECHGDVIRIYDGPSTESPLLVEFCGAGTLTEVISSGAEVLVQLYSAPSQVMHNSFAEIEVAVRFAEADDFRATGGRCDFAVDGAARRSGLLHSPRHTLPRNTTCSFRLRGAGTHDRVWIYFLAYYAEDRHPWSRRETCEAGQLDIYEPPSFAGQHSRKRRASQARLVTGDEPPATASRDWSRPAFRFCEKTFPAVCARAADHPPDHVPLRPCAVPEESYLSRGSGLVLRHRVHSGGPELVSSWSSSSFTLRYEFVDTRQPGMPDGDDVRHRPCRRLFEGRTHPVGSVDSPRNVFLFGRGGSPNVSCQYEFVGSPGERLALTFTDIRLGTSGCEHRYDPRVQRHACLKSHQAKDPTTTSAILRVSERTSVASEVQLACFCGLPSLDPRRPLVVESVTHRVTVTFEVTHMTPTDDFDDFGFEAVYEFSPMFSLCETHIRRENGSSEGEVIFRVPSAVEGRAVPLRCRWLLEASPHKYLYLRFRGKDAPDDCPTANKIVVYPSVHPLAPLSVVCLGGGLREAAASLGIGPESVSAPDSSRLDEVDVFSNFWYNDSSEVLRDHVYVEVLAHHAETVRFRWIEVTKGRPDCPFECPELKACLGAELWCDGRVHCPSGYDEDPAHCDRLTIQYVVAGASAVIAALLLALLALATVRCSRRRRREFKESRPVPTDDFPMDGTPVR